MFCSLLTHLQSLGNIELYEINCIKIIVNVLSRSMRSFRELSSSQNHLRMKLESF